MPLGMSGTGPWAGPPELSIFLLEGLGEAVADGEADAVDGEGEADVVVGEAVAEEVEAGVS